MISVDELDRTILELEQKDTSYAVCEKLAWLYTVRDHIQPKNADSRSVPENASEFVKIALSVPAYHLVSVLNEHMEIIRMLYPKDYEVIIKKLQHE